jgi:NitT/TauT family transport system permease protein
MGIPSKIAMVTIMCFFPIFMSLIEGIHRVQIYADKFLDLYQAKKTYRIFNLYIPLSLPSVFVGIKVAATLAVLGAIVAEFLGAYTGLGKNLYRAPKLANAELMMASAILTAIMGMIILKTVDILQRILTKWDEV